MAGSVRDAFVGVTVDMIINGVCVQDKHGQQREDERYVVPLKRKGGRNGCQQLMDLVGADLAQGELRRLICFRTAWSIGRERDETRTTKRSTTR